MYAYIYDAFLNNRKYEKQLSKIEEHITDLEIKGRICRLTLLNTIKACIEDEIRRGAKTIVIVGNDKTISCALDVIVPKNVTLGIIPVGSNNQIAELLGIPEGEDACGVLSARILKSLPLGKVNESYFINKAIIQDSDFVLKCDGKYQINLTQNTQNICIYNSPNTTKSSARFDKSYLITEIHDYKSNRFFKIFNKKNLSNHSILNINTLTINNSEKVIPILMDGQKIIKSPATIIKAKQKLRVIVGKNRKIT